MNTPPSIAPTVTKPPKVAMVSITINRAEGPVDLCIKTTHTTWADADKRLREICLTASKSGGYDKCDFHVVYIDGEDYSGRFDAAHPHSSSHELPSLEKHITRHLTFLAGIAACPSHMKQEDYDRITAQREKSVKDGAVAFLSKYALRDDPAPTAATGKFYRKGDTAARIAMAITGIAAIVKDLEDGADQLRKAGQTVEASTVLGQAMNARKALSAMITAKLGE